MLDWHPFPRTPGAGPGAYLATPTLARAGIRAIFTTRLGGFSTDPWETLNLAYVSGDDAATVRRNRGRALEAIGLSADRWTGGRQIHGDVVAEAGAEQAGSGADSPETAIQGTDALWTQTPGVGIAVITADCVPILLADPRRRRVAVVHAGWRGMVAGVIGRATAVFEDPSSVVAVVGPSIGPCCYEVGKDVVTPAQARFGAAVMRNGHLDLWEAAVASLRAAGVGTLQVAALCTRCETQRFFSHRGGDAGRQGLLACIEP